MKKLILICLLSICVAAAPAQIAKGDRTLAWQVDMPENANYDSAYAYASKGCMESIHFFFPWSSIEPSNGNFDQNFIANTLDILDIYHPIFGVKVELQIATVNTVAKEIPSDLMNLPFDDPAVISRFKSFLDTLFVHIPNLELSALCIGNEGDVLWGNDATKYAAYKTFLDSVAPYAKQLYSNIHGENLKIGTTFTHHGLTATETSSLCASVNSGLDIVATTYYPIESNFTMKDPSVVFDDFDDLVAIYNNPSQPIYFAECGYSSSSVCLSSEEKQAKFYENVFSAWDAHYENIKYITVFKTNDWSIAEVNEFANYYGLQDTIFKEYLRTLGVRTWNGNGANKLAYNKILCELDARDWCAVACELTAVDEKLASYKIELYPNPSSGNITVDFGGKSSVTKLTLINSMGQSVWSKQCGAIQKINLAIDGPEGIYFLKIETSDDDFITKNILKLH